MSEIDTDAIADRVAAKALVEACLVLEEGVASAREIDLGMLTGAGFSPPPFARADEVGLDVALATIERLYGEHGERFAPPLILRRLVAQGRLGRKAGQGFFPYPQPDPGYEQGEAVKLETRPPVAIAWLDSPPANAVSPRLAGDLARAFTHVEESPELRALVIASANPQLFCAGADLKALSSLDPASQDALLDDVRALFERFSASSVVTIAAVNGAALGGGNELTMACDLRIAARSASFGQPEIGVGIIPGWGGTQRLRHLVGAAAALELNLVGRPVSAAHALELGLVNRVVEDHELLDTTLAWARKLARQAPLAIGEIKRSSLPGDLEAGLSAEGEAFGRVRRSADAREGIAAFLGKRLPRFQGR